MGLSGAAHAAVCVLVLSSAQVDIAKTLRAPVRNLTFVNIVPVAPPPVEPFVLPKLVRAETPPVLELPKLSPIEMPKPEPVLHVLKTNTTTGFNAFKVRLKPDTTNRAEIPRPVVGIFATAVEQQPAQHTTRQVQAAAFEVATARAADLKLKTTSVGAFGESPSAQPQPGSDRSTANVVAEAGFGMRPHSGSGRPSSSAVKQDPALPNADSGFGGPAGAVRTNKGGGEPRQVQQASFDAAPQAKQTAKPAAAQLATLPVEILFKPAPTYTTEARSLKVEGDVSLEVEFCASGQVRILRVVRSLGHGLDEAAARAAERIQFKPARSGSTPVDYRAIVHITFRLT